MSAALEQLVARAAIADNIQDFSVAVDRLDIPAVLACVTEDVVADYGPAQAFKARGKNELEGFLNRYWRFARTHHQLGHVRIWFDAPDDAHSITQVSAWQEYADGAEAFAYAQFHDRHRQVDGSWRIAQRRVVMTGNNPLYTAELHRLERTPKPAGWSL